MPWVQAIWTSLPKNQRQFIVLSKRPNAFQHVRTSCDHAATLHGETRLQHAICSPRCWIPNPSSFFLIASGSSLSTSCAAKLWPMPSTIHWPSCKLSMWRDMKQCWSRCRSRCLRNGQRLFWLSQCLLPLLPLPLRTSFSPHPQGLHTLSSTTWYTHSKRHQKMYHKAHLWRWVGSKLHHLADGISAYFIYAYLIYQHDMYCEDLRRLQGGLYLKIEAACSTSLTHHFRRSRYCIGRVQVRYASGSANLCHSCILFAGNLMRTEFCE